MNVFSFGGGVQSTAALVLAARGELDVNAFLFANVGEDSENPATLRYVNEVAIPYAERHGLAFHELQRIGRDGKTQTIYSKLTRPGTRSVGIPVRMANGAPGRRTCTHDFKIQVVAKWCWQHGARPTKPATTQLGISLDEFQRMRTDSGFSYTRLTYPLIDRRMNRQDCMNVIVRAGLAVPPKSSCWFCTFRKLATWREMRDNEPELFAKACGLESHINVTRERIGKDPVWLTRYAKPLAQVVGDAAQPSLFGDSPVEDDACESGYCMV